MFLRQEAGAFENNIGKEPQEPRPKLKNMYIIYINHIYIYIHIYILITY